MDYAIDHSLRRELGKTLWGFSHAYLAQGMSMKPADFHREMVTEIGDMRNRFIEVIGFRGSAKSFYGSLALPLWAALEYPDRYPFIVLVGDTFAQSSQKIANLKNELDHNILLKNDYGVIIGSDPERWKLEGPEWQKQNLVLSNGVRIIARSRGQRVRGITHRYARPALIVVDDPEDLEWVKTKENRDKSEQWLTGEVIPAMEKRRSKLVLIGNHLHADGLLARMKPKMQKVLEYPLIKDYYGADWKEMWNHCAWQAMYPNPASLRKTALQVGPVSWSREYILRIVPQEDQVIKPEDIHYYDDLPASAKVGPIGHGVDLAVSRAESADFSAIVSGVVLYVDGDNLLESGNTPRIFVAPDPFHRKVRIDQLIDHMRSRNAEYRSGIFYVEANGTQAMAADEMERAFLPVERMHPKTDKWARLQIASTYIRNGTVLFPRTGCEDLLQELLNFGAESHDDLADGLMYLIEGLTKTGIGMPKIRVINL